MKILVPSSTRPRRGIALILSVLFLVLVAVFLASYLFLTIGEHVTVARSQAWNASMVLAEAGVEDALAAINKNVGQFGTLAKWTNTAAADGWTYINSGGIPTYYLASRSPDTNLGYYTVYITNNISGTNVGPVILSIGTAYWNSNSGPKVGGSNVMVSYQGNTTRKVLVRTKRDALINANLFAVAGIGLSGNNVTADSFDSGDPYHSTWQTVWTFRGTNYGYYPVNPSSLTSSSAPDFATEPYFRKDNAYIASNGSINVGNANVCGYVESGPNQPTPSIGPSGVVGDNKNWIGDWTVNPSTSTCDPQSPYHSGLQMSPPHWVSDENVTLPNVVLPTNSWVDVPKVTGSYIFGDTNLDPNGPYDFKNGYVITNGIAGGTTNYRIATQVGSPMLIRGTNIVLYLPNGLNFNGNKNTIWLDTNSDVTIYTGGNIDTTGNSNTGINNIARFAPCFTIYGLPTCTSVRLGGQPTITATIYAPQANLDMNGGGGGGNAVGAFFCRSVTMTGNFAFHYDEALQLISPSRGYIAAGWQEVY